HSRDAVQELASRLNFDSSAFVQLMDVRAKKSDRKQFRAMDVAGRYLRAIGTVTTAVDKMPGSPAPGRQRQSCFQQRSHEQEPACAYYVAADRSAVVWQVRERPHSAG